MSFGLASSIPTGASFILALQEECTVSEAVLISDLDNEEDLETILSVT